jgi:hypothetical protein
MIDIVIPTCGRTSLLKRILPIYLSQDCLSKVIIVEDGPLSEEVAALASDKVMTLATGVRSGAPAAKKLGLMSATAPFVGYGEDDAFPQSGYYARLAARIEAGDADVLAGVTYYLNSIDGDMRNATAAYCEVDPWPQKLGADRDLILGAALQARYLGRREVLQACPPDARYEGNGWREETDPVLGLWSSGKRVAVDPSVALFHLPKSFQRGGGQHRGRRLVYELWCLRNDVRFYRKHAHCLRRLGFSGPSVYFAVSQWLSRVMQKVRSRFATKEDPIEVRIT